jgi:hypothetical protein
MKTTGVMLCVSGFSGVGKDEFCAPITSNFKFHHVGFVDPAKRHMADLYGFTEQQLFGPSKFRNAGDIRYPKPKFESSNTVSLESLGISNSSVFGELRDSKSRLFALTNQEPNPNGSFVSDNFQCHPVIEAGDPEYWLSPREALQKYCGLMNDLYLKTWAKKGVETHEKLATGMHCYTRIGGLRRRRPEVDGVDRYASTCFSDFRHIHEFSEIKSNKNGLLKPIFVRILSERVPNPPFNHRSETEQTKIEDKEFHYVVHNNGTVDALHAASLEIMGDALDGKIPTSTKWTFIK